MKSLFKSLFGQRGAVTGGPQAVAAPEQGPKLVALAEGLRREGKLAEAAVAYGQALEAGAEAVPTLLQLGAVRAELEEFPAAEQAFRRLVALDPAHADAWCMLGIVAKDCRRFDEAIKHFDRALALHPDFSEAWFNQGLALFELGRLEEASRSFLHCVELRRGPLWGEDRVRRLEQQPHPVFEPMEMGINEVKLRHDCEQLAYLIEGGQLPAAYGPVLADYRALLEEIRGTADENRLVPFDAARHPLVARTYKRPVHIVAVPPPASSIINPALDFEQLQDRYLDARPCWRSTSC